MQLFPYGHATHPQWQMAAALVLAQVRAQMALHGYAASPTLGLLYITDRYAGHAKDILEHLQAELPLITDWSGTVGVGIVSSNVEYWDEPAMALMLLELPSDQYRVFSGVAPLGMGFEAHTALVHADGSTADLTDLIDEMAARTDSGFVFGGIASSRADNLQFAVGGNGNIRGHGAASGGRHADGPAHGGFSQFSLGGRRSIERAAGAGHGPQHRFFCPATGRKCNYGCASFRTSPSLSLRHGPIFWGAGWSCSFPYRCFSGAISFSHG